MFLAIQTSLSVKHGIKKNAAVLQKADPAPVEPLQGALKVEAAVPLPIAHEGNEYYKAS